MENKLKLLICKLCCYVDTCDWKEFGSNVSSHDPKFMLGLKDQIVVVKNYGSQYILDILDKNETCIASTSMDDVRVLYPKVRRKVYKVDDAIDEMSKELEEMKDG